MLKKVLRGIIPENLIQYVPSSFDIVGSREKAVAIIQIPEELKSYEREIAKAIMSIHKNVKTVLAKESERYGYYRIRRYHIILGDNDTEVYHKENGIIMKLDPRKVYFSPREGTERARIARMVRPKENVMVMFAGIGPYALNIVKFQPLVDKVIAIEINPIAYEYMIENIRLNKMEDKIIAIWGNVKQESRRWYGFCDRVVMPLPKGAYKFLDKAFLSLKPSDGVIHFYYWSHEKNLFSDGYRFIEKTSILYNKHVRIIGLRKVLPYAPRIYKICIDFRILD